MFNKETKMREQRKRIFAGKNETSGAEYEGLKSVKKTEIQQRTSRYI